jgi:hypothetical protein
MAVRPLQPACNIYFKLIRLKGGVSRNSQSVGLFNLWHNEFGFESRHFSSFRCIVSTAAGISTEVSEELW